MTWYEQAPRPCLSLATPPNLRNLSRCQVATGGTLSSGVELVRAMGATVVECACVVELKMFIDPPADSGLPSRKKSWEEKGIADVPVWGLVSEDILTLEGELPPGYVDDGEEH